MPLSPHILGLSHPTVVSISCQKSSWTTPTSSCIPSSRLLHAQLPRTLHLQQHLQITACSRRSLAKQDSWLLTDNNQLQSQASHTVTQSLLTGALKFRLQPRLIQVDMDLSISCVSQMVHSLSSLCPRRLQTTH